MNIHFAVIFPSQDIFRICSPGGGGYGPPSANDDITDDLDGYNPAKKRRIDKSASQHYHEKGSVYAYRLQQEQV